MAKNGYFQLACDDSSVWFEVHLPEDGGKMFDTDDVVKYLDAISFSEYDLQSLDAYIKGMDFSQRYLLSDQTMIPESEKCIVTILPNGERALARFYPPTTEGKALTEEDIISDLQFAGIRHGIKKKAIQHFLENREYCRDYIVAEATAPIQGKSASVEYFFDLNTTAKPKLNEDGSVDFHQLGNIKAVQEGDKLATLTPADRGRAGISVTGKPLPPKKVNNRYLKYGRNIRISADHCNIYSKVAGHVTLVDDMVMVSNVYEVPANVDPSTGDIDYKGTVQVTGNVNTGYTIKAEGDIIVNGVVEGATLISGGNIVLKRGMQGMERGKLQAAGNITAKFLENCKVECEGSLKADAILHSEVRCKDAIEVLGRKGLINGGSVMTYADIHATALGSTMGAATRIEVLSDREQMKQLGEVKEKIEDLEQSLAKIDKLASAVRNQMLSQQELLPEQVEAVKKATISKPVLVKELKTMRHEREALLAMIEKNRNSCIRVEDVVYSGVTIVVKDVMKIQSDKISHCRFVRDGADIRTTGL